MNFIILCACGCGTPTKQVKRTRSQRHEAKGCFLKFVNGHNTRVLGSEEQKRRVSFRDFDKSRYTGSPNNYIKLKGRHMHRVVMEQVLGRKLTKDEVVHHIDENKWNNSPENLQVMTRSEHIKLHLHEKKGDGAEDVAHT